MRHTNHKTYPFVVLRGHLPRLAICAVTCGASWGLGTNVSSPKSIRFPTVGAGCAGTGAGEDDAYKCKILRMGHMYTYAYQNIKGSTGNFSCLNKNV